MTEELRLILLAAGILIIAFIAWDATRRKKNTNEGDFFQSNQNELKNSQQISNGFETEKIDSDGYDDLGLTQPRVTGTSDQNKINIKPSLDKEQDELFEESIEKERLEPSFSDEAESETQQIVSAVIENDETISSSDEEILASSNIETLQKPETVITINLMASEDSPFAGNLLLQELLTLGFKYGEMGIFHRYQQANGQGERWFCLANAINPGSFDLDKLATFSTPGLTLFMLLPGPQKPLEAFDNMLNAAEKLRRVLGGKLEDGSHCALSQQRIQMYQEEIKIFLKKQQIEINHSDE